MVPYSQKPYFSFEEFKLRIEPDVPVSATTLHRLGEDARDYLEAAFLISDWLVSGWSWPHDRTVNDHCTRCEFTKLLDGLDTVRSGSLGENWWEGPYLAHATHLLIDRQGPVGTSFGKFESAHHAVLLTLGGLLHDLLCELTGVSFIPWSDDPEESYVEIAGGKRPICISDIERYEHFDAWYPLDDNCRRPQALIDDLRRALQIETERKCQPRCLITSDDRIELGARLTIETARAIDRLESTSQQIEVGCRVPQAQTKKATKAEVEQQFASALMDDEQRIVIEGMSLRQLAVHFETHEGTIRRTKAYEKLKALRGGRPAGRTYLEPNPEYITDSDVPAKSGMQRTRPKA